MPMTSTRKIPDKASSSYSHFVRRARHTLPDRGYFVLVLILILLAGLASFDFSPAPPLVVEGEIATQGIYADKSFIFEDGAATAKKKEQAGWLQPLVCDLVTRPAENLRITLENFFIEANRADTPEVRGALREALTAELNDEISADFIHTLGRLEFQKQALSAVLPVVQSYMKEGVLPDMRMALPFKGGVTVRTISPVGSEDPNTIVGEEVLHQETQSLHDIKSVQAVISQTIKPLPLSPAEKRVMETLFFGLLRPTLVPNYEVTKVRTMESKARVEPVVERIQKGEILVRQGDRVTREQQLKAQTFADKKGDRFKTNSFIGISACGVLLSFGLLFSPSAAKVGLMLRRDYIFIAALLVTFALIAKGLFALGTVLAESSPTFDPATLAYAVPIAGASGLAALIFTTRRYLVTGLLLAFYCAMMSGSGLGMFLFYFLGAMWSTWLTARAQTRQDMVVQILPLCAGLLALWFGSTFLDGGTHNRYLGEALATVGGAAFSLLLVFSLAPVLEMVFNYTTRFRLMELLNLEQPLLQDLMLNAPGTYHHSLIVANMVEAGAKAIGAHSLICKVGALYHDIGKISKANYFIENQLGNENPHDQLAPSMSALILISHSKQGGDLGVQHRLSKEVTDIIRQHHGTSAIRYFYQKALHQADATAPKIEDFSYPGPRPQTREAGIVMLADAVEASSRTLANPTSHRLQAHIDNVLKNINADGQLDETNLTFKELSILADSFHKVLRGIFHHRIAYPAQAPEGREMPAPKAPPAPAAPGQVS